MSTVKIGLQSDFVLGGRILAVMLMVDMISTMRDPVDDFGKRFRAIRTARKLPAADLSIKLGKHRTYISAWERDSSVLPPSDMLDQASNLLGINDADRAELFMLVAMRTMPARVRTNFRADPYTNLRRAIADVEHSEFEHVPSQSFEAFIEAMSWLLPFMLHDGKYGVDSIRWPKAITRLKIKPRSGEFTLPEELVAEEMPDLKSFTFSDASVNDLACRLASIYRRWVLSDPEKCQWAASKLSRWELTHCPGVGAIMKVKPRDSEDDSLFGANGVRPEIVIARTRRELAQVVWEHKNTAQGWNEYVQTFGQIDAFLFTTYRFARNYLNGKSSIVCPWIFQAVQDCIYLCYALWEAYLDADTQRFLLSADVVGNSAFDEIYSMKSDDVASKQWNLYKPVLETLQEAQLVMKRRERERATDSEAST